MINENIEKFATELHDQIYNKIYDSREENYYEIQKGILESFRNLLIKINEEEKEVSYINVSLLRSNIKNNGCLLLISAYNAKWFLDNNPIEIYYDCSWLLKFIHEYNEKLSIEAKKYVGKVTKEDIERIKWESLNKDYKGFLIPMFRNALENIIKLEEYKTMKKALEFSISVGEYKDLTQPIWVESEKEVSLSELKFDIEQKNENKIVFKHFKNLDLSNGIYENTNFMYTKFETMNFTNCNLHDDIFMGSKFWNCNLQNADLSYSVLWFSDFEGSNLRGADFSFVNHEQEIDYGQIEEKIFNRINFKKTDLTDANLMCADLAGCDFRDAILDNCNMEDAFLYKALINKEYKNSNRLILSEDQEEVIIWV